MIQALLSLPLLLGATLPECSQLPPFEPASPRSVSIVVDGPHGRVCETPAPLEIGIFDVRGRESDWYHCFHRTPRPSLECTVIHEGQPALLKVRPASVIRRFDTERAALDTHAHIFLLPGGNGARYKDTFVRSMSLDLSQRETVLDSFSAWLGEPPEEGALWVRLHFR